MKLSTAILVALMFLSCIPSAVAEDGYDLWLRYKPIEDDRAATEYSYSCRAIAVREQTPAINAARQELSRAITGLLELEPTVSKSINQDGTIIIGTLQTWKSLTLAIPRDEIDKLGDEGYIIWPIVYDGNRCIAITGHTDRAVLYGTFHFLRLLQTGERIRDLRITEVPGNTIRMIYHVEHDLPGRSVFQWDKLPTIDIRYHDYGRMLASIGINSIVINNDNDPLTGQKLISSPYIKKIAALADVFRCYGVRIYLAIDLASPILVDQIRTADPLDPDVRKWWAKKVDEVYRRIPDFGGILVNADPNSEYAPETYKRGPVEAANMLAEAFKPHNGLVIWRTDVPPTDDPDDDEALCTYERFQHLDGQFAENVVLQIKHHPTDLQVRAPVSPLIGAMPKTNQILELQITQKNTGFSSYLCYLPPLWRSLLEFNTYIPNEHAPTVARVINGTIFGYKHSGIAAVYNATSDRNWTGRHLAQVNLYGFGRLAWDPFTSSRQITGEWRSMTFGRGRRVTDVIFQMFRVLQETYEAYTSPLGLSLMSADGQPTTSLPVDRHGVGFDRTIATGTGFVGQYYPPLTDKFESLEKCPDDLLLYMHHVPYTHELKSKKTVIQHLYDSQFDSVERLKRIRDTWIRIQGEIDDERYEHVLAKLDEQIERVTPWRDSITKYFYEMSGIPDEHGRISTLKGNE